MVEVQHRSLSVSFDRGNAAAVTAADDGVGNGGGIREGWLAILTGAAEDTGHTGELDGLLAGIHFGIFGIDSKTVGEGWTACLDFLRRQLFFPLF